MSQTLSWIRQPSVPKSLTTDTLNPKAHKKLADAFDLFATEDELWVAGLAGLCECYDLDKPVIAAINGDALGGWLETVLACNLAVAVDTARLGLPEPRVGLCAHGGLHRLTRHLPGKTAARLALTGRLFSATEGKEMHLVNEVVPREEFAAAIEDLVEEVLACAPLAIRATKQMMTQGLSAPDVEAAFAAKYPAYDRMLASKDALEGPNAFVEKRNPVWRGR